MSERDSGGCARKCWMRGGIIGLVLAAILYFFADYGFWSALLTGVIVAVVIALLLWYFLCRRAEDPVPQRSSTAGSGAGTATSNAPAAKPAPAPTPAPAAAPVSAPAPVAEKAPAAADPDTAKEPAADASSPEETKTAASVSEGGADAAPKVKPSKPLPGQAELAARKGEWKYEAEDAQKTAAPAAAAPDATPAEAPATTAVPEAAPTPEAAPAPETKPKRAPVAADGQPEIFDAPQGGAADDLKLISGVGPKLEQTLNDMGIWHFAQVAGWRKKEIAWVDARLRFKGRIERDDWIGQAKILAKGGETEFSKRKKK